MTPGRPFVQPQDADLDYCPACGSFSWTGTGHRCPDDPLNPARGIILGLLIVLVFWGLVAWLATR